MAESGHVVTLMFLIFLSLSITSIGASIIIRDKEMGQANDLYNPIIPSPVAHEQDYTENNLFNSSVFEFREGSWVWNEGIGFICVNPMINVRGLLYLYLQPDSSGYYENTYFINDTVKSPFYIWIRDSGGAFDMVRLYIENDGFHIKNNFIGIDEYFLPVNNLLQDNMIIKTRFNDKTNDLIVYLNNMNTSLFEYKTIGRDIISDLFTTHYGGVRPLNSGFTLYKFEGQSLNQNPPSFIESALGYLTMAAQIAIWTIDPQYLPLSLNFILIKTQLFAFFVCLFIIVRD